MHGNAFGCCMSTLLASLQPAPSQHVSCQQVEVASEALIPSAYTLQTVLACWVRSSAAALVWCCPMCRPSSERCSPSCG